MQREARRTLYTLTTQYQQGMAVCDYEVIAVDSGSTAPLDGKWVESLQPNFRYQHIQTRWPTPCEAMNLGVEMARSRRVVCMIDGARMLSPGVLRGMLRAFRAYPKAYVHTLALHLGQKLQDRAMLEDGYCQQVEDQLLGSVDWRTQGYRLFDISCVAASSGGGYLHGINESNCFAVNKAQLQALGGFDERFQSPGGGLVNLDLHRQLMEHADLHPVMLLGEGSFHQFHGGVATNSTDNSSLVELFKKEYLSIRGAGYVPPRREPAYLGKIHPLSRRFLDLKVC